MINFDQLYARTPYNSLTGTEIIPIHGASGTGAGVLNTLKAWIKSGFVANDVTNASTIGKTVLTAADLPAVKTALEIPALPLAPVTISADTTLTAAHANRRIHVTTSGITLTLDATAFTLTDCSYIKNLSSGNITIALGSGEDFIVKNSGPSSSSYTLPAYYCTDLFRTDSNTWFIGY